MCPVKPDTLENLAMQAIEDHVSQLCVQLIQNAIPERKKLRHAQEKCERLKCMLHYTLPSMIANRITAKLLKCIDSLYDEIRSLIGESWFQDIIYELLNAIIHPGVTMLELGAEPMHSFDYRYELNFILLYLFNKLCTMNDLKVIRLANQYSHGIWAKSIRLAENLEEFTSVCNCSDTLLEAVSESCRNVTDSSIKSILKLQNLEELSVMGKLSQNGLTDLLIGLAENRVPNNEDISCASQLLSYGCYNISTLHVTILVKHFPNLVELKLLCSSGCDFTPLKELKHLKGLWLSNIKFNEIRQILQAVGEQLLYLHLIYAEALDVKFIGMHCPMLKCLHLIAYDESLPLPEDFTHPLLPGFQSVECLHLNFPGTSWPRFFLFQCKYVRKLVIYLRNNFNCHLLELALQQAALIHLEEMYWSPTCSYADSIAKLLLEKCPKIRVIRPLDR
ncbi:hypothetical protein L9F63_017743 [Diploptera punctata]|uniref:Uncharacterized protein n=1 Tax=Diploptera punctata TaxID=6984 RepID=A0AAD7ZYF0_DIPPU|nr:hypothetical protein L9F63_017743 [Diploptera punctata]